MTVVLHFKQFLASVEVVQKCKYQKKTKLLDHLYSKFVLWKVFPHKNGFEQVLNKLIEEDAMQICNAIPKKESERKRGKDNKRGMWNNQQWSHTQTTVIQICVRWRMKCRSRCERALVYYFFLSQIEQWTDIILVFIWDFFHGINLCIC